ncbi:response regulator [Aliikangiella marina]|uniref:Response regulator n=1 Tax=Aliikangiella marina TaxID=1712262 RepID=A0A545TE75_9GAMM|nr:response regulator [Aliikangiella marina]TQV75525.1 response regulator [Aliikangiella marina]
MLVLVADDNDINVKVASAFLKSLGVPKESVVTAQNGEEAIEKCQKHKIDLIFMDIQMPVLDGLQATREILKGEGHKPVIVALTANATDGVEKKYLEMGMKMVIPKPVTKPAFQKALELIN